MSDIAITFAIAIAVIALFVWNRIPAVIVAIGTALALYLFGIVSMEDAVRGLGDPAVLFIATLFVIGEALDSTGVTAWVAQVLMTKAGESQAWLLILIMVLVAGLTALISVNGAVAALLPMVVVLSVRLKRPASKLLLPLVFASHAGSMLTLTGTPVNVLVSEASRENGLGAFRYFEFGLVGIPLTLGTMAILLLFGDRLLPDRSSRLIPADFSEHARTLIEQYALDEGVFKLRVAPNSSYVGLPPTAIDLTEYPGLVLVGTKAGAGHARARTELDTGDLVVVRGDAKAASALAADKQLAVGTESSPGQVAETLLNRQYGLTEIVIPPRSEMAGSTVFPGMITPRGDLVILAVQRAGEDQPGETMLMPGDTLLLRGTWETFGQRLPESDVLVVDSPDRVRRQSVPMGKGAIRAIAVLIGMVVVMATDAMPAVIAGLIAACLMVLLGTVSVAQAYRSINWTTVILVGGMMPLSTAISSTGAAAMIAHTLVGYVGDYGPYALLAGLFLLTAVFGQMISNTATALIVIPIAIAAARELGISPRPVLMSVAVAAAASFLTPIATPVNLMVKAPGGYQFGDYWKLGLPLMLWFFLVANFLVPAIWKF